MLIYSHRSTQVGGMLIGHAKLQGISLMCVYVCVGMTALTSGPLFYDKLQINRDTNESINKNKLMVKS